MNENNETPAVGEVPAHKDCVYGPWWDDRKCSYVGLFWRTRDGGDSILDVKWFDGTRWFWTADCSPAAHVELLRVSSQNQSLRALVGELAEGLEYAIRALKVEGYKDDSTLIIALGVHIANAAKAKEAGL